MLSSEALTVAKSLRMKSDLSYPEIEQHLYDQGFRDRNGRRIHNAAISSDLVKTYPELRVRRKKVKLGRPKSSKNKTTLIVPSTKNQINALKALGFSDAKILKILSD